MGRTDRLNMRLGVAIFLAATLVVGLSVIFFLRDRSAVPLLVGANIVFILSISLFLSSAPTQRTEQSHEAGTTPATAVVNRMSASKRSLKIFSIPWLFLKVLA